jgi:hypothetical protein
MVLETSSEQIRDKGKSSYPLMNNISISESGVTKLLQNIKPHKATGRDEICGRVLKVVFCEGLYQRPWQSPSQ